MFSSLPQSIHDFMDWSWSRIEPYYQELILRPVGVSSISQWLADWTRLKDLVDERYARLKVAIDLDTTSSEAEARYHAFLDTIHPASQATDQKLKEKLLASGLEPENFAVPLQKMRAEAGLFREANLPLLAEERKLASQYDRIIGAQTVPWEGKELTVQQLRKVFFTADRSVRQKAWQLSAARQLADREANNALWGQLLSVRSRLAENSGQPDYRAYRWQQMLRLDYRPQDCFQFHEAIEAAAVPAATRIYERHRQGLGITTLRPWDLDQDLYPIGLPVLPSYGGLEALQETAMRVFRQVDPQFGEYFRIIRSAGLLDVANHKGKAPGAYSIPFPASRRPFIFMNAVGLSSDARTLLHEAGHAFHHFERYALPYAQQRLPGLEFAEVASMAMELLASPYLSKRHGGFYSEADTARFQLAHLERILLFWPYMAVVDAFQHWVYDNDELARDPANCDAKWLDLWQRYLPGVDWSGLEAEAVTGWHRKQHIFRYPFYYVEYGLAQLGAVQVWRRALQDQAEAVRDYRRALALGGTARIPELYRTAGAKFAFDRDTLQESVDFLEKRLARLESEASEL